MAEHIKNCGECPHFEWFLDEYEPYVGIVGKGRCHKHNQDEIWETKAPCVYGEITSLEDMEKDIEKEYLDGMIA